MKLPVNYNEIHWTDRRAVRREYIKQQKGKCAHCGESLDKNPCPSVRCKLVDESLFPKGFFKFTFIPSFKLQ